MKHIKLFFLAAPLLAMLIFSGCKKGTEDPFFTIHSRLSRVTGTWTIKTWTADGKDQLNQTLDSTTFVGSCGTETDKTIATYTLIWNFNKTGSYTATTTLHSTESIDIVANTATCLDASTSPPDSNLVIAGNWNFTTGIGTLKNKEQLYIYDPNTKVGQLYDIIGLHNKKMHLTSTLIDATTGQVHLTDLTMEQ